MALLAPLAATSAPPQEPKRLILPETRKFIVRDPATLPPVPVYTGVAPRTVIDSAGRKTPWYVSLDDVLAMALADSDVVRILTGTSASASGVTPYDPASRAAGIDQARGRFDPTASWRHDFNRFESPVALSDPLVPALARIAGTPVDRYDNTLELGQSNLLGGRGTFRVLADDQRTDGALLNPRHNSAAELAYVQPLLRGGGFLVNQSPILVARIDAQRSFFQLKDALQEQVRSIVAGYWQLVAARVDVWAREQQIEQATAALAIERANLEAGRTDISTVYQAETALASFRASLIAARGSVIEQEAALRNVLGLPPADERELVPISRPVDRRLTPNWDQAVAAAAVYRPDIVELKLVLEADAQLLLQRRNEALPQLDAELLYRWNGLEGRTPSGAYIQNNEFTDWRASVNFSVPLGLRAERAAARQQQLLLIRDQANLRQGVHAAQHQVAQSYRLIVQGYEQYLALKEFRRVAELNIGPFFARQRSNLGNINILNILQAIASWGDAVSSEAQSLATYNAELANFDRQIGLILERHGVRFYEERYRAIGPLGRLGPAALYPQSLRPGENKRVYGGGDEPSEEYFDLEPPVDLDAPPLDIDLPELPERTPLRLPGEDLPSPLPPVRGVGPDAAVPPAGQSLFGPPAAPRIQTPGEPE